MPAALRRSSRQTITRTLSYAQSSTSDVSESPSTMSDSPPPVTPVAKRGTKRALALDDDEYGLKDLHTKASPEDAPSDSDSPLSAPDSDEDMSPSKKKRKSPTKKTVKAASREDAAVDGASPVKKVRKPRPPKPEPVYVIPDVEKKITTFKGRLGYACLNTVLRNKKPADMSIFCSRTCRLDTINQKGIEWAKELGRQNVKDLIHLIEWNEKNNIRFMRMSSEMFPFASHPEHGYTLEFAQEELSAVGELANKYGHRLTTHPGQFTQLGSPRKEVVRNAVRDLAYHCEMIDRMGLGKDSIMIIHGGGMFGDKPTTLARIRENYVNLLPDNVKARLVLENDEMCYSAEDLLPLCEDLSIPLVFDYHHDWILPSSIGREEIIRRANAIFASKGIKPKQHLSEPRPGAVTVMERRAHSDRCQNLPNELPDDMDLMIEAKDKEQAVLHLYRIYDLHPVIHESLRPPADVETTQTKGRKSHKPAGSGKSPKGAKGTGRKKATKVGIVGDEDEVKGEDPAVLAEGDGGYEDPEAAGAELKAEEHAYAPQDGELVTPVKKKRAPRKKAAAAAAVVKDEREDVETLGPAGKKKRGHKATAAKAEIVDPAIAETSMPDAPETSELKLPVLPALTQEITGPSPAKKRRVARTKKVETMVSEEVPQAPTTTKATRRRKNNA